MSRTQTQISLDMCFLYTLNIELFIKNVPKCFSYICCKIYRSSFLNAMLTLFKTTTPSPLKRSL